MMFSIARTFSFLALVSLSAAQFNLSPQCTATLANVFSNPDVNQCLQPSPLLSILTSDNASIIGPINNWLGSLCPAPACSNATIGSIVTNVTNGCPEVALFGSNPNNSSALATVEGLWPLIKQVFCLKDGNTYCVTETLTNIQNVEGPLTLNKFITIASQPFTNLSLPTNITCTNCVKAAYNILHNSTSDLFSQQSLQGTCGADFVNGQNPSGISSTASSNGSGGSSPNGKSGSSVVSFSVETTIAALLVVLGGFAFLA